MKLHYISICIVCFLAVGCSSSQIIPGAGLDDFQIIYPEPNTQPTRVTGSIMDNGAFFIRQGVLMLLAQLGLVIS